MYDMDPMDITISTWNDTLKNDMAPIPNEIKISGATLGVAIIIVGVLGNTLIIMAIVLNRSLYKSSNMFVVSLAVCDLAQNLLLKPLYVYTYVAGEWKFGGGACVGALYAHNLAILESISHVTAIALHRYLVIVHPRRCGRLQSTPAVRIMLAITVATPIVAVVAPNLARITRTYRFGEDVVFNRRIMFCSFVKHSTFRLASVLKKLAFLSVFAGVIFYCYIRIYLLVRRSGSAVIRRGGFSPARLQREITLLKSVAVIFMAFVVTYLPISMLYAADTARQLPYWAYFVGVATLWSSSSSNWLIYGLMNASYRKAYVELLCGRRARANGRGLWGVTGARRPSATADVSTSKASYNVSFRELPLVLDGRCRNSYKSGKRSSNSSADKHARYG